MKCGNCGADMNDNSTLCLACGWSVPEAMRIQAQYGGRELTKKEFYKSPEMKMCRGNINGCGIALYILGILNIGLSFYTGDLPLDGILMILFGLGIQLAKSRVCSILCTIYGGVNMIIVLVSTGGIGGWIILLVAIDAITYTFKFQHAWAQYKNAVLRPAGR